MIQSQNNSNDADAIAGTFVNASKKDILQLIIIMHNGFEILSKCDTSIGKNNSLCHTKIFFHIYFYYVYPHCLQLKIWHTDARCQLLRPAEPTYCTLNHAKCITINSMNSDTTSQKGDKITALLHMQFCNPKLPNTPVHR